MPPVTWPSHPGLDALHFACRSSITDPANIYLLIQNGADVYAKSATGKQVPLDFATGMGNLKAIGILLDNGVDINHWDGEGKTAVVIAVQNRNQDIVSLLIQCGAHFGTMRREGRPSTLLTGSICGYCNDICFYYTGAPLL